MDGPQDGFDYVDFRSSLDILRHTDFPNSAVVEHAFGNKLATGVLKSSYVPANYGCLWLDGTENVASQEQYLYILRSYASASRSNALVQSMEIFVSFLFVFEP